MGRTPPINNVMGPWLNEGGHHQTLGQVENLSELSKCILSKGHNVEVQLSSVHMLCFDSSLHLKIQDKVK